ncbi:hypothetical protein BH24ACI3_BH24ACI3_00520 [soil metagenome]
MNQRYVTSLLVILVFALLGCGPKEHPKDAVMKENFAVHRAEFEELLKMFKEDRSLGRVGAGFTRTASFFEECKGPDAWNGKEIEVSQERIVEYQNLFVILGLPNGIEGYCEKENVSFYASSKGLSVSGSSKGYAYLEKPPVLLVDDLDSYWSEDSRSFTAYRHIDGNWYLYFDYED